MLQDPKDIVNVWMQELTKASTVIIQAKLKGEVVEEMSVNVTISIAKPLLQAIANASEATGTDPDDILSEMASQGFQSSLNSQMHPIPAPGEPKVASQEATDPMAAMAQLKGLGLDMSGIEGKMSEFTNMVGMLTQMKEKILNVESQFTDDNDRETSKDSE